MKNRSTWTLPLVIDPVETVCVQIQIPKDENHIAAFWGALEALNKAWNWQYTDDHKGSQTARVWQKYIDAAAESVRIGDSCIMPIDCNEVEACLTTSPIIAQMNADITANTGDIALNMAAILSLQGRMTTAENDIIINSGNITTNTTLIAQNTSDIALLQPQITANDNELANHEIRITALEAGGGGGGGDGGMEILTTTYERTGFGNATAWADNPWSTISHQFTYPNALIMIHFTAWNNNGNVSEFRISTNGLPQSQVGLIIVEMISTTADLIRQLLCSETFVNLGTDTPTDVTLQMRGVTGTARIAGNSNFMWTIIEYGAPLPPPDPNIALVTFDPDGYPYVLPVSNSGIVTSGGNPDDCIVLTNVLSPEVIDVEFSWGALEEVVEFRVDYWSSDSQNVWLFLVNEGDLVQSNPVGTNSTWQTEIMIVPSTMMNNMKFRMVGEDGVTIKADNIQVTKV